MDGKVPLLQEDVLIDGGKGDGPESARPASHPYQVPEGSRAGDWRYVQAAIYLKEGIEHIKFVHHPTSPEAVNAFEAVHSRWLNLIDITASIILMLLAFFEQPSVGATWPVTATALLEMFCLFALHIHTVFYFRWKGSSIFKEKKLIFKILLSAEMLLESIVILARQKTHIRIMRAFRPIFIIDNKYSKGIKRVFFEMIQSLPPVMEILVLLITFITTFAVMGYYLFGTQAISPLTNDDVNWYFINFEESWVNLFILLTTANYPDVMMPAYKKNPWAALFFIIYLMFALYFLANLLLAAVYSNFNSKEKEKFGRLYVHRRLGLRKSFNALDRNKTGSIDFQTFCGAVRAYQPGRRLHEIILMFKAMDKNGKGYVTLHEWFDLYEILLFKWREDRNQRSGIFCSLDDYPESIVPFFIILNKLVTHTYFEYAIDVAIVVNCAFLLAEADLTNDKNKNTHAIADYEQVFVAIYTVEAAMKITGMGFQAYFSKGFNVFDFCIVAVSLIGQGIEVRTVFVTILRPFRLFRLFKLRQSFQNILSSIFNIIPRLLRFVNTLLCVYYFFAVIGMESFAGDVSTCGCSRPHGGEIQCDAVLFNASAPIGPMGFFPKGNRSAEPLPCDAAHNCTYKKCGEHYSGYYDRSSADGLYYLNNFDNIVRSYIVLFELMVVNNWHVTMQGTVDSTSSRTNGTRAFFILFYLVTVVIVTNVVVAFILDAFQSLLPALQERVDKKKGRDEDDNLTRTVVVARNTFESIDDPKFVAKLNRKGHHSQAIFRGKRNLEPIDIYMLIFSGDIDNWKEQEEDDSKNTRERQPVMMEDEAISNGVAADGEDGINLQMLSKQDGHSTAEASYQAPEYVPAKTQNEE